MQQLTLMKPELIEKLNGELGRETIGDLTMRLGEVAQSGRPEADEGPAGAALSADERDTIEQYVREIPDSDTREAMRRVIEKDFLNRKKGQQCP
jgi:hypothetical protein